MLTFCRRAACRAGMLVRRRHHLPPVSSNQQPSAPLEHDYLALDPPDSPQEPQSVSPLPAPGRARPAGASAVDELAAQLRRRRRHQPGSEAVIAASFGVIRLDADNRPLVHGQFEPGLYGDGDGETDPELAAAMAVRHAPGEEPAQRVGEPLRRSHSDVTEAADFPAEQHRQGPDPDLGWADSRSSPSAVATGAAASPGHTAGFVDEQYFPDPVVSERPTLLDTAAGRQPGDRTRDRLAGPPEDVFDEQYFAEAFEPESASTSSSPPPLPATSPLRVAGGDPGSTAAGGAKLEGRPQGVFDEQYFWSAFEDTGEEREAEAYKAGLAAKYSEGLSGQPTGKALAGEYRERQADSEQGEKRAEIKRSQNPPRTPSTAADHASPGHHHHSPSPVKSEARSVSPAASSSRTSPSVTDGERSPPELTAAPPAGAGGQAAAQPAGRRSALDVVRELRAAARRTAAPTGRGRQLRAEVTDLASLPAAGVLALLRRGVLHDAGDFIVLYKPPGLSVHSATERHPHRLTELLPALARHVGCAQLHTVHRLDRDTSGALLLAKTPEAARRLSELLREGRVVKTYWALVRGAPDLPRGVVEMPVMKTVVGGRERMTLAAAGGGATPPGAQRAVTRYRVLSRGAGCALLELTPATGARHQLRAHLGLGLGCPVLGDHKYSRWETAAQPQRLPPEALAALGLRAPEARHVPMHLHARALWLPGLQSRVTAPLPLFFKRNLRRLKMAAGKVKADGRNYGKDD